MKYRKSTAILLWIAILLLTFPVSVFAEDTDLRYGRKKLGELSNGVALQYVYDKLVDGCTANTPQKIDVSHENYKVSTSDFVNYVFPMFYSDYPEYFWISNGGYSYSYQSDNTILSVTPAYHKGIQNLSSAKSTYTAKVNEMTKNLSGSDYDKAKTLHDRLIQNTTYTSAANDQNAYGALVEGKAVCNGYARAYQHLMQKAGIPAWYVRGSSINPATNKSENHAWNLVKLDGQWYYTDVTWDDQGDNTFYAYMNITTQQLLEGHAIGSTHAPFVPQATATDANYYRKENRIFSSYDQEKLVNLLQQDHHKTQIYITGNVNTFLSSLSSNLLSVGSALGGTGSFQISYRVIMLGKAMILDVSLVSENHTHKAATTVSQVNASCLSNGTKAYYVCDCGLKFWDSACSQQIDDVSQLTIPVTAHTPSGWKNDATNHWKECTKCGSETVNTLASHGDSNQDHLCDTCGYALPVADENGNTTVDGGTSNDNPGNTDSQPPSNPTQPNETVPNETVPNVTTPVEDPAPTHGQSDPTEGTKPGVPVDSSTAASDESTPVKKQPSSTSDDEKSSPTMLPWIIIAACVGVVIITVLIFKKKQ